MNCEIEFLPVGDASRAGDAIVVRYGDASSYELMIVDGGNMDSGKALVEHVRKHFSINAVISHVVLTHAVADHASGLRVVLADLPVTNLWMHVPWAFAAAYFANKNWTVDRLREAIRKEYDARRAGAAGRRQKNNPSVAMCRGNGRPVPGAIPSSGCLSDPAAAIRPHARPGPEGD
jgi:glyoxylase-like metal-dependent hydrolase (beta-lactamase superfamily II)